MGELYQVLTDSDRMLTVAIDHLNLLHPRPQLVRTYEASGRYRCGSGQAREAVNILSARRGPHPRAQGRQCGPWRRIPALVIVVVKRPSIGGQSTTITVAVAWIRRQVAAPS